jgi:hypothetical protein
MTQDEFIESARQRVRAFLDRYAEMRGLDPTVLYNIGDKNGDVISLYWADLNALVCATGEPPGEPSRKEPK